MKVQRPVNLRSEFRSNTQIRYLHMQKLNYVILIAKRKLLYYFESHHIMVVTSAALSKII
jgi:hypothetical protein